tara:strand:- start:49 stop:1614 length:1566 start_codon:yes stop_codon:yes gene_type:complete
MIFSSGTTTFFRRHGTFVFNWTTSNPVAAGWYAWCPDGTTVEIVDFPIESCIGMVAQKNGEVFEVIENPNNGTETFLINNPNSQHQALRNRIRISGNNSPNGQFYVAKYKIIIPDVVGNDGSSDYDVGGLFLDSEPPAPPEPTPPPEPEISWDDYHPLDLNRDGIVNVTDAVYAAQNYNPTTAQIITRYVSGTTQHHYDLNNDGMVNVVDVQMAVQAGVPQHICDAILQTAMNPPAPTQEYVEDAPIAEDGSNYHPLDFNQDGEVSVMDIVAVAGNSEFSQITKTLIINMIQRYMDGICPYDVNQDGQVNVLDIQHCTSNGVPENIIQDMVANIGAEVPQPVVPEPEPPVEPGPWLTQNNLWLPPGNYGLLNGTPYYGPVHKHYNNLGHVYMTEKVHKNHSRLLVPLVDNPEDALLEMPNGSQLPAPVEQSVQPVPTTQPPVLGGIVDTNGDGITNILDLVAQLQQLMGGTNNLFVGNNLVQTNGGNGMGDSPPAQTGGQPSNQNQQQNNNSGGGGGGGAY